MYTDVHAYMYADVLGLKYIKNELLWYHPDATLHTRVCICRFTCVYRHTVPLCVAKCTCVPGIVHVCIKKYTRASSLVYG